MAPVANTPTLSNSTLQNPTPLETLLAQLRAYSHTVEPLIPFAKAFFSEALPDELEDLTGEEAVDLLHLIESMRSERPAKTALVRLDSLSRTAGSGRRMALVIINDDMPFLVDSITAELAEQGLTIHRLFHPIIDVVRDAHGGLSKTLGPRGVGAPAPGVLRESVIYIEVDRLAARERLSLAHRLELILSRVRICVEDWQPMVEAVRQIGARLRENPPLLEADECNEIVAFLDWLAADQMTLLGVGYYPIIQDTVGTAPKEDQAPALGLLRDHDFPLWRGAQGYTARPAELAAFLESNDALLITKANSISSVHRRVHLDYVGVKAYNAEGLAVGEYRIVGLFTSNAYATHPRDIPILRQKVAHVVAACQFDPRSHAGKALLHVLATYPRDELFQVDKATLQATALGLLSLQERPRPKLFFRPDRFERFVSIIACVPRDAYRADIREKCANLLTEAYQGRLSRFSVELSDQEIARIHYIIATTPGQIPDVDPATLDKKFNDIVRGWGQQLENALIETLGSMRAARLGLTYTKAFSAAYQEQFNAVDAAFDIDHLSRLKTPRARDVRLYRFAHDAAHQLRIKVYSLGQIIPLSDMVPVLEHMGLKAIEEYPYDLAQGRLGWVHDFLVESANKSTIDLDMVQERLRLALIGLFNGQLEDDAFNGLILSAGLEATQVVWLRALFRYIRQTGASYGLDTVSNTLARAPEITRGLIDLFVARHDPQGGMAKYDQALQQSIQEALKHVSSLEEDRILRQYFSVILSIVRTNAFVPGGPEALAFKIRSRDVPGLPLPIPFMEIFVYSPRVEGIHLRGGKVARGGLRWSDRRDDFRTEVLGLIKAQMVKNAVIVPVGAKGGFYPKQLPSVNERDAWFAEGLESYKIYIRALLSLTDNLVDGKIVPPDHVVRLDEDDPYLVVAADKGTATFSDVANAIAVAHGFWLGDAFASGGSQGYDHKKMAITAKGAWVAVERHFREQGVNVASDPIRVIGVGDMSGDVFGNGLLRSQAVKLVAAFDHRHIFIDPNPDPTSSFAERQRLFDLPRSSWADYAADTLSAGGFVVERKAKSVSLTPQARTLLGIEESSLTPNALIQAILTLDADLLWLGGIGTYIKARDESHAQVGDKANDDVRVDAEALRVRVIGEGANLGITQKARIAFAHNGGRLNTDFIDNSAGVDCSDNEVNIKILLSPLEQAQRISRTERDALLEAMTHDVSTLVLRDNYLQTQALSIAEQDAFGQLQAHIRLIHTLEQMGGLNRLVEDLPSDTLLEERRKNGRGLTRPELAILLAYAKMTLYQALLESDVPDQTLLEEDLYQAFPQALQERFAADIKTHRLRREIVATKLANAVVNRGGLTLAFDLSEATGASLAKVCAAFAGVRTLFDLRTLWREIDGYDYQISAQLQLRLQAELSTLVRAHMLRLLGYEANWSELATLVGQLRPGVQRLLGGPLATPERTPHWAALAQEGAPDDTVNRLAQLDQADSVLPISAIAWRLKRSEVELYTQFQDTAKMLGLDWLTSALEHYKSQDPWERLSLATLASDLLECQLRFVEHSQATHILEKASTKRLLELVARLRTEKRLSLAMLSHAISLARGVLTN